MATLRRDISLDAPADQVWSAVRDFGQVHVRVAPGFLTALEMDDPKSNGGDRIVTFFKAWWRGNDWSRATMRPAGWSIP